MICGVGCRCGSDPALLWLWCRPAGAAPIGPLAWDPPYTTHVALKSKMKKRKEGREEKEKRREGKGRGGERRGKYLNVYIM